MEVKLLFQVRLDQEARRYHKIVVESNDCHAQISTLRRYQKKEIACDYSKRLIILIHILESSSVSLIFDSLADWMALTKKLMFSVSFLKGKD
ncbi:hypothetical protein B1207_06380 [Legionella quinlivanii]|uniref:Uncharacterized protein n=1 Tax=Legionella quinlivanii TaxID=45073 RepID=A0A364LKB0_9GAMM|nr:hypothetical protein B1207_06380 [Legionella quinlivanii]